MSKTNIIEIQDPDKKKLIENNLQKNFIYNRFDIFYNNNYSLFYLKNDSDEVYIPVHFEGKSAFVGMHLVKINKTSLEDFIKYLFKNFSINKVKFKYCGTEIYGLKKEEYCFVKLDKNIDDFTNKLSSETRYNIGRYTRKIEKDFKLEIKHYDTKEIIENKLDEKFIEFKNITHGRSIESLKKYISYYLDNSIITDAYVMFLDNKIVSIVFIDNIPNNQNSYLENLTYDIKYKKYSVGTVLYFNTIKALINENKEIFYLGDNSTEYKTRFNGQIVDVYSGTVYRYFNKFIHWLRKF